MHFVVCAKQIPDPETPPSAFKIDEASNSVVPAQGFQPVLSQFDGIAAEAALRIKEAAGDDTKITVLSMGAESAQAAIKQVLAMGADEGVLLQDAVLMAAIRTRRRRCWRRRFRSLAMWTRCSAAGSRLTGTWARLAC